MWGFSVEKCAKSERKHYIIKLKIWFVSNDILMFFLPRSNLACAGAREVDDVCVCTRRFLTDYHI